MPSLTSGERVKAIMRWLYNHPDTKHTYDSLGKALDIPSTSVRKTIISDFPQCFTRRWDDKGITLPEPVVWPDAHAFDLYDDEHPIDLSDIEEPDQLTAARALWDAERLELVKALNKAIPEPKVPRAGAPPKGTWNQQFPRKDRFDRGQQEVLKYPELAHALSVVMEDPMANKTYYPIWELAMYIIVTLKALRNDSGYDVAIKEWIK